jgi:hypothetical protein
MKYLNYSLLAILLLITTLHSQQIPTTNKKKPVLINKLGLNLGMNFPFGAGALREGAYPFGLSLYVTGNHTTTNGHNYELLTGAEIIADFGGGIYFTLPVLVNKTYELASFGNNRFLIDGFAGLGYSFHHIFTRTEGIIVKNQHTLGLDAGLIFNVAIGRKWAFNLRPGVFRSFTKPVQAYFAGQAIKSETKFRYTTFHILLGFSRKIGQP